MAFQSDIGSAPVIDDTNFHEFIGEAVNDPSKGRGLIPRDFAKEPYASSPFAGPLTLPLIPQSEWAGRIEEQGETKSSLVHIAKHYGIRVKNQASTNYCWINAPTYCAEVIRAVQNQKHVSLSPASIGAKIKGFRNVGGWGTEGLAYGVEHGWLPSSLWSDNLISRAADKPANDPERAKYRITQWFDLKPRNLNELATALLRNVPVAIGLNWWGHEVTAMRLVKLDGSDKFGIMIANSWGESWGDKGFGVLSGSKMLPDDAVAPAVAVAS